MSTPEALSFNPSAATPALTGATFLVGRLDDWMDCPTRVAQIFSKETIAFLDDLSYALLQSRIALEHPSVAAFGLWCRRASIEGFRQNYDTGALGLGRGMAFHISPSNVPVMFAYSLAIGLLSGNANIVRLPSREHVVIDQLLSHITKQLTRHEHASLRSRIACIRYPRNLTSVTEELSARCNARIIWGGDTTISLIRRAPLPADAVELLFPNRTSLAVIDADAWLKSNEKERILKGFFNDTYLTDQTSCSSPRAVVWLGNDVEAARIDFWTGLKAILRNGAGDTMRGAVAKIEYAQRLLATRAATRLEHDGAPEVLRLWCESPQPELLESHPGGGAFVEHASDSLEAIVPFLSRRCQTISYFGVSGGAIAALLRETGAAGCLRIVPIGHTLDFSLIWDGHDTIRALSRTITTSYGEEQLHA